MSKLDELIKELCPDGVEYKTLGEIATISRGGNFQKKDFCSIGIPCIHYGQIYTQYGLFAEKTITFIPEDVAKKQKFAKPNDIIMAVTSENIDDVCKCLAWLGDADVAVSGHSAIISHNQNSKYLVYYFHSQMFYAQKRKLAHGTKVIEVTPDKLNDIKLPVPPLEVQREIVRVLDSFTLLTAELTAELTARKKQYEFYRDKLLTFGNKAAVYKMSELCESIADGDHMPPPKSDEGIPFITISNVDEYHNIDFENTMYVPEAYYNSLAEKRKARKGDILYTVVGSYGIPVCVEDDKKFIFQRHIAILRPNKNIIKSRYMFHAMQSTDFKKQADKSAKGAAQKTIALSALGNMKLPVPRLDIQEKIIEVLDNFESICTDLSIGLPAEIEARQKQYEYYRDLLLTFAETGNTLMTDRQTDRQSTIKLVQYVFGYAYLTLDKISENCDRQRKPVTKGKREAGKYPYYGASGIVDYVSDYIFDGDYLLVSEDGANLLARSTPIAFSISGKNWVNNHAHVLKFDTYELRRYVEIYLNSIDLSKYISGGAQPKLNQENLNKINIPIPANEQIRHIVNVFDRFDTLCNDLSTGLPAEIEARQKQYEYYRDKLLFFEEKH